MSRDKHTIKTSLKADLYKFRTRVDISAYILSHDNMRALKKLDHEPIIHQVYLYISEASFID